MLDSTNRRRSQGWAKAIRDRDRIEAMNVNPDGSVRVMTRAPWLIRVGSKVEDWGCWATDYTLL